MKNLEDVKKMMLQCVVINWRCKFIPNGRRKTR